MIRIRDLSMSYGSVRVLDQVSLSVDDAQSLAIVGPSGSGKTTLLLLLAGLELPCDGQVEVDGVDLASLNTDALADLRRDRVGIVFQSVHLIPSLTALDNVALPLQMAAARDARQRARVMLTRVGLGHREAHYPAQLSGGEQQRVAIARALVHEPAILLADEPTGNLDKRTGQQVSDLLFELHRRMASTMVLVTHDETMAQRCDRVLRLDEGRLVVGQAHEISA
jgi:putative ABC transport system ATP-binding protein